MLNVTCISSASRRPSLFARSDAEESGFLGSKPCAEPVAHRNRRAPLRQRIQRHVQLKVAAHAPEQHVIVGHFVVHPAFGDYHVSIHVSIDFVRRRTGESQTAEKRRQRRTSLGAVSG